MDIRNQKRILFINMFLAALIVSGLLFVFESSSAPKTDYQAVGNGINVWSKIYSIVLSDYVGDVDPTELATDGVKGMLKNLDPYSSYFPPGDYTQLKEDSEGEFAGLGIMIGTLNDYPTVMEPPFDETPAMRANMRAGDAIVKIESESTFKMPINKVVSKLRGKVNTIVNISIQRANYEELIELSITRQKIPIINVPYSGEIEDDIGYIKLWKFNAEAPKEMRDAIDSLQVNENLKGIILDLRNNPGGLLNVAHDITNMFIPKGSLIVFTKGRRAGENKELIARDLPRIPLKPIVLLVNRGSASASEIVAGAIQDWDRGVLIGETTFGKGSVQTLHPFGGGAGLKLTTAKYYTPSGRCIHRERNIEEEMVAFSRQEEELRGTEESVEDSLKSMNKFYTKIKQRIVYEGGGVTPDIVIKEKPIGNIITQLSFQQVFYDFAFQYSEKHPDLTVDFPITDELVEEFREYIKDEKVFTYKIPGKSYLDNFKKLIEREGYNGDVLGMIEEVEIALAGRRDDAFNANFDTIKRILKREIAGSKFGSGARTVAGKQWDRPLLKAIELLNNPEMYNSILSEGAETGVIAEADKK